MISRRLAIVSSHPVQYYAPWFQFLASTGRVDLKVFYLWDHGVRAGYDPGFGKSIKWDVPLLDGYPFEFVPNISSRPGTDHFFGLRNPTLANRVTDFGPDAALLIGYNHPSFLRMIFAQWPLSSPIPLIFRGDSHRLVASRAGWRDQMKRALITAVYKRFAACLYVGTANREYFRWYGVPDERLYFSPHAIHTERFTAGADATQHEAVAWRMSLGVPPDHLLVMFAGKFEEKKRPTDLLEAFVRLGRAHASLLFVGAGHLEGELRQRAHNVANVHFAPFQNQSQMPRTYLAADLFVLPSYGPGETWGLAINEALSLARPVITSDHVGCTADLVSPGRNGLVFRAGDVADLTHKLREALSDGERLLRWGEEGRRIVERYKYEQASEGLFAAMEAVTRERVAA